MRTTETVIAKPVRRSVQLRMICPPRCAQRRGPVLPSGPSDRAESELSMGSPDLDQLEARIKTNLKGLTYGN